MFQVGDKIRDIELVGILGEGASSRVFLGKDTIHGFVAVKVLGNLKGRFAKEYREGILVPEDIFLQEIAANERLRNHSNIAYYHYADKIGDNIFIMQEFVDGSPKRSISFTYDTDGLLQTFVDANGHTTQYAYYDESSTLRYNLLKSITFPKGNTILVDYDEETGKATSFKDSASPGNTEIAYDPASGITEVTDPENHVFEKLHTGDLLTAFRGQNDSSWTTIEPYNKRV